MQDELRPILLRRMKEDVEDLPQKEEIVVRVQLTRDQRKYYKAIFAKQVRICCSPFNPSCLSPAVQHLFPAAIVVHDTGYVLHQHVTNGKNRRHHISLANWVN